MGGGILTRNAFTLIELLAIIVILAIIAVITVPIILNIIENSRRGAATDSAYGYKDSINKWFVSKLSSDPNYNITDGEYRVGQLGEQVEGQKPDSQLSWFVVSKNEVTDACLQFDEYKVEISSGKVGDAVKGECKSNEYVPLTGEVLENIQSYFSNDIDRIVYYNPIDGVMNCTDYDSSNSTPGYKGINPEGNQTKCLKWYKYSTNKDGSINMILDHNTETETETGTEYYAALVNNTYINTYGPADLMQYLTLSEWTGVLTRSDKYTAYKITDSTNGTTTKIFTNATGNAVNYSGKKARLITAQEIADIVGNTGWNEQSTSSDWFLLDNKVGDWSTQRTADNPSDYYWLFENLYDCSRYGCSPTGDNAHTQPGNTVPTGNFGYWTSSPDADNSSAAWDVDSGGYLDSDPVFDISLGVRPVITVPASVVSSS